MQLISKYNKGISIFYALVICLVNRCLLCVSDLFSKYTWVVLLKDKKGVIIVNAFQSILKNLIENRIKYG